MEEVGRVEHYFDRINVAVVALNGILRLGDRIRIRGKKTDFEQEVESMQIEHKQIDEAGPGEMIGLKVKEKVREGDVVYKL